MSMSGIYGFNLRINGGINRDNSIVVLRDLGGAFALIQDDPTFAAQAASLGIRVVYRASGDDPQSNPLKEDPAAFVQKRADAAPTAAYIHLTNEVDPPSADLHRWTRDAMKYADSIRRKVCIYNYGTNKSREAWLEGRDNIHYAVANGHAIGLHIYEDGEHDDGAYDGWLSLKREVGGLWIVTEYAPIKSIFDANTGWRAFMPPDKVSTFMGKRVAFFADERMPVLWFSYDDWKNDDYGYSKGFGIWREPGLINRLTALNRIYKYQESTPVPQVPTYPRPEDLGEPSEHVVTWVKNLYVNLRQLPSASSTDIGDVKTGDRVLARPLTWDGNGYKWARLERPAGWIASELLTLTPVDDVDAPRVKLDVPYVSQLGADAKLRGNDCGVAAALMVYRWRLAKAGLRAPRTLTVDRMMIDTPLSLKDAPQPLSVVQKLLDDYGVDAQVKRPLTASAILAELTAGRPVILLVNYKHIGGEDFGHYIVVYGAGQRGFYYHDPYKLGSDQYIATADLERALTDVSGFAAFTHQGVVLAA